MKNIKEKLKEIFEKYGNIISLGENVEEHEFYKFTCNTKYLYGKDSFFYSLPDMDFALVHKGNNECVLFCFRVGINDMKDEQIYRIINQVNKKIQYGKYTLDSDGDIDWEYRFDISCMDDEGIKEILTSFYESMLLFVMFKREERSKQKEGSLHGQESPSHKK